MAMVAARLRPAFGAALRRTSALPVVARAGAPVRVTAARAFSGKAGAKVCKVIEQELKHEEENYEQAKEIKAFLASSPFKLVDEPGNVNMVLEREMDGKVVKIEWQLMPPYDPEGDAEGGEGEEPTATELSVSVESKSTGAGLMFYCSTQTGEEHRYVIGQVKTYASAEERDSVGAYNGPEFEDLDDKLQEAFDEYLAELGMSSEVCDFVDQMAVDKEQREYCRWLQTAKKFLE
ncbi:unnamed protein product [Prorocentrum cordatum]|uniref:Mitochondrial acidic protein MAM33 n=1 Tax=Prorocentrum cordatum TaxID=2364126 RepID=A0ABN9R725_9DINO|nr:unnamed protein product [Polarella glacialis]CAK0844058.1 unnamed protein product [Polarella glacialis]